MSQLAVIMGDIVSSEQSTDSRKLHQSFNKVIDVQNSESTAKLVSPLTITLGDEFQGLAQTLSDAGRIVRDLRLQLMEEEIDCRFVVGTAELSTEINSEKAWNMMGTGLSRTRQKLNEKKANTRYRFSIEQDARLEANLDALGSGLTVIEQGWTKQQRKDTIQLIKGLSPAELAQKRNVSVHSIYKVRSSSHFDTYLMLWNAISENLKELDVQNQPN